ncbi:alpha/beta hydrolase [Spirillospora sp. CA-294931]|uniref:alpha/beta hydrolase n=1 Tax=Spirillospora sp. CA-294931 TaxID=3240042 RepID=UPI003D929EB9
MAWTRPIPAVAVAMAASVTAFGLSTWGRSADSTRSAAWASRALPASVLGQRPVWKGCGAPFECTSVKVPRDYSAPENGGTIALALVRVRAARPQGRLGSLVFAFGGPGSSGIEGLRRAAAGYRNLNTRYDLVSFDPRGAGRSTAVDCLDDASMDRFVALDASPDDPAEETALTGGHTSFRRACQTNSGGLLPYVGTSNAARDLDVVRAVLGDRRLHYFGTSYGTWLGGHYAHQLPGRVGRAVLDGAVDTELGPLDLGLQQAAASQRALGDFAAFCARACPSGVGQASIAALLDELDRRPLPAADGRELTQSLGTTGVSAALRSKRLWPALARGLTEAKRGGGTVLLALADTRNGRRGDGRYGNLDAARTAITCADTPDRYDAADVRELLPRYRNVSPVFGPSLAWDLLDCAGWPVPGDPAAREVSAPGAAPMVVIGTTGDPATPYAWAPALTKGLGGRAALLTLQGEGHGAYDTGDPCVRRAVDAYLLDGVVPSNGATCG